MAIILDKYEEFGNERKVVIIDKSDNKHPNRILNFAETVDPLKNTRYTVTANWTPSQYHPTIFLDKNDIKDLINCLQNLIDD